MIERQGKKQPENVLKEKKDIKSVARTSFGMSIHRALFQEPKKQGQRNIFKSSNCYDFDVNPDFGSALPKLVIRSRDKHQEDEKPITVKIGDNILGKVAKIMTYIKSGKRPESKKDLNDSNNVSFLWILSGN